ncbi:MAG: acyl carrier protein [Lachnospiraceae bacterium]|nr:acyl carrier protein [Lachnospiraceae bacterium]
MTLEKIANIIAEQLGTDAEAVKPESSFKDDLGVDSLDLFQIIMAFEEEFGIEIPTEEAETIVTVQDAINYIESKKN